MATQLVLQDDFDNFSLNALAADLNDALLDRWDFEATILSLPTFPCVYLSVGAGPRFVLDTTNHQLYQVTGGNLRVVAGQWGVPGFRDGPGNQALLSGGGFQESYSEGYLTTGEYLWTDAKIGRIRKATPQPDGSVIISTYAVYTTTSLSVDGLNNVWTTSGSTLIKIAPGGGTTNYNVGVTNVNKIRALANGHVIILTRNNAWDVLYDFNPATNTLVRIMGMNDAEIAAYKTATGITDETTICDGAANINSAPPVAAFHSPEFAYVNSDGSEIWMGGGDERQLRRYRASTGRVDSLYPDGIFRESLKRIGGDTGGNPSLPFFMVSPGGPQPSGAGAGYPFEFGRGGVTAFSKVIPIEVGGPTNSSTFTSQSIPSPMIAGQQYSVTVTMANNGSSTWTAATDYKLGGQSPHDSTVWNLPSGGNRVLLGAGDSIAPGQSKAFTFPVRAPATPGGYPMQFRMVREAVEWFGAFTDVAFVTVVTAAPEQPVLIPVTVSMKY